MSYCATVIFSSPVSPPEPLLVCVQTGTNSCTGPGAMTRAMDAARRDRIDERLLAADRPVLVLRGRHDRICPSAWADALVAGIDHRLVRTLAAGAHMVPLTHGRLVAEQAAAFVATLPS